MSAKTPEDDDKKAQPGSDSELGTSSQAAGADSTESSDSSSDESGAASAKPEKVEKPSWKIAIAVVVLTLVAVLLILFAWRLPPFATNYERTENAYIRGQITVVSPQVSGYITGVLVEDFQHVTAGQPLFRVDSRIYQQQVDQAKANLASAEADRANATQTRASAEATLRSREAELSSAEAELARAHADDARTTALASQGSLSVREREQAQATLRSARAAKLQAQAAVTVAQQDIVTADVSRDSLDAGVASAAAQLKLAEIELDNTTIVAPEAGRLGQVGARQGQYVSAGTQLVSLVPPKLWIIANFKERQISRMQEGQRVELTVDALDDANLTGRVRQMSPATGSEFSALPAQNATGNFTKVAQRLPVRIELDANQELQHRLRPGMSVVARVDVVSDAEENR